MSRNEATSTLMEDLVQVHVLDELKKLKIQNKRLKDNIEKTGNWLHIKHISQWKTFDFYNYFCLKYNEKYQKEYDGNGSITASYKRIDSFMKGNNISNENYREFIETAFKRYFNAFVIPVIGHVCSATLYNRLMDAKAKSMTTKDLMSLDQIIARENEKFKKVIEEEGWAFDGTDQ